MQEELKALETVRSELSKLEEKYRQRADKERAKVNDVYITIQGEKCYTAAEIDEFIEADRISASQADRYIDRLRDKQAQAGQKGRLTQSERVLRILENLIKIQNTEISDLERRALLEQQKNERWEKAKAQGISREDWLLSEEEKERELW